MTPGALIAEPMDREWKATPLMLARWRAAGGRGLPTRMSLVDRDRLPKPIFLAAWREAFPGVQPPSGREPMFTRAGAATDRFAAKATEAGL